MIYIIPQSDYEACEAYLNDPNKSFGYISNGQYEVNTDDLTKYDYDVNAMLLSVFNKTISQYFSDKQIYENYEIQKVKITEQPEPLPFARPDYRTKRDATSEIKTCSVGTSTNIDFIMPEERYVYGGKIIVRNAEFGDYVKAQVVDSLGLIPEPYRAPEIGIAENYPVVSEYVIKEWINPSNYEICSHEINTYPLNARITQGLCLRVIYYSKNTGIEREVVVNYYLSKRLPQQE